MLSVTRALGTQGLRSCFPSESSIQLRRWGPGGFGGEGPEGKEEVAKQCR